MKKVDFASVKLPRQFVAWLKVEAARRGVPMYEFAQIRAANPDGVRPWDRMRSPSK